ncbi:hypothetical protein APUTEX25_005241 [Auxenochlorella protothecoides]|uniref:NADP-dependent oxidoreductase domain-containing protein n=1 Tax=Auxenochlorella protothecoides TaxID=3075 RepID=A0A1D1ZQM0_AUXPR|nr:hypothetical protein APUTEX25_005241 [Auxenochlorella protothecoides]|eukprot:RMZ53252.1 hypothetical protein APUTEX25_005241 [Auxenochlorella protothecoides]
MPIKVPTRPLGSTGLEISIIGFGASPLGNVFGDVHQDTATEAVRTAFDLGITLFDTSPFYGLTKSEDVLGQALRDAGLPRDQFVLATKVGRYGQDTFDFSGPRVTRSVEESLERLHTSYIDLIQVHDMEFGSLDQIIAETLPALQRLKEKGLVRHIGITGLPLACFQYVLDRVPCGTVDVVLSYCHYTLCDQSLGRILPYLESKAVGVINASVLGMGLLTPHGPPAWHPAPAELQAAARAAARAADARAVDLPKLATMFSVAHPGIATHLIGFSTPDQVRNAVHAVLQAQGLEENAQAEQEERAMVEIREILAGTAQVTWPSGLPENSDEHLAAR